MASSPPGNHHLGPNHCLQIRSGQGRWKCRRENNGRTPRFRNSRSLKLNPVRVQTNDAKRPCQPNRRRMPWFAWFGTLPRYRAPVSNQAQGRRSECYTLEWGLAAFPGITRRRRQKKPPGRGCPGGDGGACESFGGGLAVRLHNVRGVDSPIPHSGTRVAKLNGFETLLLRVPCVFAKLLGHSAQLVGPVIQGLLLEQVGRLVEHPPGLPQRTDALGRSSRRFVPVFRGLDAVERIGRPQGIVRRGILKQGFDGRVRFVPSLSVLFFERTKRLGQSLIVTLRPEASIVSGDRHGDDSRVVVEDRALAGERAKPADQLKNLLGRTAGFSVQGFRRTHFVDS